MADESTEPAKPAKRSRVYRSGRPNGLRQSLNTQQLRARRIQAVELRMSGLSYDAIAERQGISEYTAREDIRALLAEREAEAIPLLRQVESDRLDFSIRKAMDIIEAAPGTERALKAIDRIHRAVALRANLFGLNAPVTVHLEQHTEMDREIAALVQAQEALNQQAAAKIIEGTATEAIEGGPGAVA